MAETYPVNFHRGNSDAIDNNMNTLKEKGTIVYTEDTHQLLFGNGESLDKLSLSRNYIISVEEAKWEADGSGFKQQIDVSGITDTATPIADIYFSESATSDDCVQALNQWACVSRITTGDGHITVYAYQQKPSTDFTIMLKVID